MPELVGKGFAVEVPKVFKPDEVKPQEASPGLVSPDIVSTVPKTVKRTGLVRQ